jgi:RecB family exonuclease
VLGAAGARAVLREAIEREQAAGFEAVGELAGTPGFRRRLARRIASWRRAERSAEGEHPDGEGAVDRDEWRVYGRYLELLGELGAAERRPVIDGPGLAGWASLRLAEGVPEGLIGREERLVAIDPPALPAVRRAIGALLSGGRPALVAMAGEGEDTRLEVFAESETLWRKLSRMGFERVDVGAERPAGIGGIERELFRADELERARLADPDGLRLVGEPEGDGLARGVAQRVAELLEAGARAEEVVVLVRSWDEQADQIREAMAGWGLPVAACRPQPLRLDPAARALVQAARLPVADWEGERLVRFLRNGLLREALGGPAGSMGLAGAAAAVRDARVYRGFGALRDALNRHVSDRGEAQKKDEARDDPDRDRKVRRGDRAEGALPVVQAIWRIVQGRARSGTWDEQVGRLGEMAADLGLEGGALDALRDDLDEIGEVLAGLGQADREQSWREFVGLVESVVRDQEAAASPPCPGGVLLATVDEARGRVARHIVLANLAEGTFPAPAATRPDPVEAAAEVVAAMADEGAWEEAAEEADQLRLDFEAPAAEAPPPRPTALGREMLRFLRVVAAAEETLTLVYPTAGNEGNERLQAGFLDDLRELFEPAALSEVVSERKQLDPGLLKTQTRSPSELRIKAVARAMADDRHWLSDLARDPGQRREVVGILEAVRVSRERLAGGEFGRFDGGLADPAVVAGIARTFGGHYTFSATQLESIVLCPYQFLLRYVLKLDPVEDRDDLDEDRPGSGLALHRVLEKLHEAGESGDALAGAEMHRAASGRLAEALREEQERRLKALTDVEHGLRRIEYGRLERALLTYMDQLSDYVSKHGMASCSHREYKFGKQGADDPTTLVLGEGESAVRLAGSVDRIDLVRDGGRERFRVIDYKMNKAPGRKKIESGQSLQHSLYAMAVERGGVVVPEGGGPVDMGYWAIREKGYRPAHEVKDEARWAAYRDSVAEFVVRVVDALRRGMFPVLPRDPDCTNYCEYRIVCRIHQARPGRKSWADDPRKEPPR